jgi:hypothetical protein
MPERDDSTGPKPSIDFGYPVPAHGKTPAFHSIEEEAAFWDRHDITDFLDQLEQVDVRFARRSPVPCRFDSTHPRLVCEESV